MSMRHKVNYQMRNEIQVKIEKYFETTRFHCISNTETYALMTAYLYALKDVEVITIEDFFFALNDLKNILNIW